MRCRQFIIGEHAQIDKRKSARPNTRSKKTCLRVLILPFNFYSSFHLCKCQSILVSIFSFTKNQTIKKKIWWRQHLWCERRGEDLEVHFSFSFSFSCSLLLRCCSLMTIRAFFRALKRQTKEERKTFWNRSGRFYLIRTRTPQTENHQISRKRRRKRHNRRQTLYPRNSSARYRRTSPGIKSDRRRF